MLLTCRSTVLTLSTSSAAIALLVAPAERMAQHLELATGQPVASPADVRRASASTRARSGAAPSSAKAARAASSSSAAVSSSPSSRHANRHQHRAHAPPRTAPRARCQACAGATERGQRCPGRPRRPARPPLAPAPPSPPARHPRGPPRSASSSRHASPAASTSPTASMISTQAGSRRHALAGLGGLGHRPADRGLGGVGPALRQPQQGEPRLRLPAVAARLAVGLLGRVEVAAAGDGSPPAGNRPRRRPPRSLPAGSARRARRASSSASAHAPRSCRISARWTRQRPVNATRSGWRSHQRVSAAVHSCARRTSWASWQARITPQ